METLCKKLTRLLDTPEEYLRPSDKLQLWIEQISSVYNFVKAEEGKYDLPSSDESLNHLNTDGLDTEQIWQLLELQNQSLLAAPDDLDSLGNVNLCFSVAKLSSLAKYNKLMEEEEEDDDDDDDDGDSEDGDSEAVAEGEDRVLSEISDMDENPKEMMSDDDNEEEEEEQQKNKNKKKKKKKNMKHEDDDDNEEEEEKQQKNNKKKKKNKKHEEEEDKKKKKNMKNEDDVDKRIEKLRKNVDDIDGGLNLVFDDDSDNEEDNFDEFIAPEGMEDSDYDADDDIGIAKGSKEGNVKTLEGENRNFSDEENEMGKETVPENTHAKKKFGKTEVDSKFFRLRECEWVADNDIIGANYDMDTEDIDLMQDISDGEDEEVMYDTFFDGERKGRSTKPTVTFKEDNSEDEDDGDHSGEDDGIADTNIDDAPSDKEEEENAKEVTQLLGLKKKEDKSSFEKEREKELVLMSTLEEDNISEKPWFLKGEAVRADRPENSTLEEHLEYNIVARQRPVITEDTTALVEKLILSRIRAKAWNDVERVVKPITNPFEYKKKLLLNQEKSKKSLAEIYEAEYLKKQKQSRREDAKEEFPEHKAIREEMDNLFGLLEALSNYHYTPKMVTAELKIQSNLPAISVEEANPDTVSDAALLAPQEIMAPVRGELRGKSERTDTDKNRERRSKKYHQRKRAKTQNRKLKRKLEMSAVGGKKLDKKTTLQFVHKAIKAGQVTLMGGQENKSVKSSQTFFKKLQDTTSNSKFKNTEAGKNKRRGKKAASKLLL